MDIAMILITFLHNCIAGFLMPWLGLLLVNIRPPMKKLGIIALSYGLLGVLLRSVIHVSYDISFLIQMLFLVFIVTVIFKLNLIKSIIANILGVIVLIGGETAFTYIIADQFGSSIIMSDNPLITLFIPLPQIIMALTIIYLCKRFEFHLFDYKETNEHASNAFEGKRIKTITVLILVLLLVIIVQLIFNLFVINKEYGIFSGISLPIFGVISATVLILGVVSMGFLIMQLMELTHKESQFHTQALYIETLDELYTAIRSERHDIINHLQTIYGFNQLGYTQEVHSYLKELLGGNILSNDFIVTGTPGLTALFYIKSGVARTNDIKFQVNMERQIDKLAVSPYELNNILGNLINNAFDAVMPLDTGQRLVNVYIGADDDNYIFTVANYGYIDDQLQQNILKKGFSTKAGEHAGLGLYTCNKLVTKYGGRLEIKNSHNHMVDFSVVLPINLVKGELYESAGSKTGAFTG